MQHPKSRCGSRHSAASHCTDKNGREDVICGTDFHHICNVLHSRIPIRMAMVWVVRVVNGASWVLICGTTLIDGSDVIIGTDAIRHQAAAQ
ncbi:hypothetical protein IG631_16976 [Alternaria alternata]|nr:hypothetical protein IG631_16976 [Alternaria alternata]